MNYSGSDICILHLSDLHIINEIEDNYGKNTILPLFLKNLIADIGVNTRDIDEIIIVVSGDIAYKANYNAQKATILRFFDDLHSIISNKIRGIVFVPGNHDIKREEYDYNWKLMNGCAESGKLRGYSEYMNVVNCVRKQYGFSADKASFGIEEIRCGNYNCCFIKADTAWCTSSKENFKQGDIVLGEFQKKSLLREYRAIEPNSKADITFLVSHYPMAWLSIEERECMLSLMMREEKLNTDVILCGHIHNVDAINYANHEHSLLTLITGIGWPDGEDGLSRQERRYSIYKINPVRNTCDIIMRKSNESGKFDYDYSIYTENREKECSKIVYPLRMTHNKLAFITLNSPNKINEQNIQISPEVAGYIQKVSDNMAFFSGHLTALINRYKKDFFERFGEWLVSESKVVEDIQKGNSYLEDLSFGEVCDSILDEVYFFLYENLDSETNKQVMDVWLKFCIDNDDGNFCSFLDEICQLILDDFSKCFPSDALVRTHFRKHCNDSRNDYYRAICSEINTNDETEPMPKDLPWGGFVKAAYENKTSLVYSANKKLNNIITDWQEFITIIPQFEGGVWTIMESKRYVERPVLTFGISVKGTSQLLDTLMTMSIIDFLKLEGIISHQIDEYVHIFGLPLKKTDYCE